MKHILLLTTLLFIINGCTPNPTPNSTNKDLTELKKTSNQSTEREELEKSLDSYTKATIDNDIDTLITFIYPKAFTIVPKEKMISMLKKSYTQKNIPQVKDVKHLSIDPIQKYDKGVYSTILSSLTTIINSPRPNDPKFEAYMLETLQKQLGERGKVNFNQEKHQFSIDHTTKTIALKEDKNWTFTGFKQAKKYIQKNIFPTELIDKIK